MERADSSDSSSISSSISSRERSFNADTTASKRDIATARRAGWTIVDYPVPESVSDRSYHVCQCDGVYGQCHYGIIKDLSASCNICKVMLACREKNCTQHVYVEGRRTFPLKCERGHQYLASSHKKTPGRCPMCTIEDECKIRGRTIYFDSECIYVSPDTRLRYYCQSCTSDHYITGAKWASMFNLGGKKARTYRSVIDWCQNGKHHVPDGSFTSILSAVSIFEQLFDARFDDCDDIIAANNKFLSGIYFTGYNRNLKLAFVHTLDPFYSRDNVPLDNWCKLRNITLLCIDVKPREGYDIILTKICTEIIAARNIRTRFDNLFADEPPEGVTPEFYRTTNLISCILTEGSLPLKNRITTRKK